MGGRGGRGGGRSSADRNGGGGGAGGGGNAFGGSSAEVRDVLQLLQQQSRQQQQLLQTLVAKGGGDGGNQQRRSKGSGAAAEVRDGDWRCGQCNFAANFARRKWCFECSAPRTPQAARSGSLSSGPVGAGGLRPQLAWGTQRLGRAADPAPSYRVPGASVAAAAQSAGGAAQPGGAMRQPPRTAAGGGATPLAAAARSDVDMAVDDGVGSPGATVRSAPPAETKDDGDGVDADGFRLVASRASRGQRGADAGGQAGAAAATAAAAAAGFDAKTASPGPPAASGARPPVQPGAGPATREAWGDCEAEDEDHIDEAEDDPAALKQKLDAEEATVRLLVREGMADEHPAMRAAVAAKETALRAWQAARRPHPIGRRMGWAQRRLDRASKSRDKIREELAQFDDEVQQQRAKLLERLAQAQDKVSRLGTEMEDLQLEASAELVGPRRGDSGVCARVAGGMREKVAPSVAALAAAMPADSEAARHVALLMAQLEAMQKDLESHASAVEGHGAHQSFVIADDGDGGDDGGSDGGSAWSESHDLGVCGKGTGGPTAQRAGGKPAAPAWRAKGHGRWWNKDGDEMSMRGGGKGEQATASGRGQASSTPAAAKAEERQAGGSTAGAVDSPVAPAPASPAPRGGPAPATPGAEPPADGAAAADGNVERPNKSRRGSTDGDGTGVDDAIRATELMQEHRAAAAAGAFGTEAAVQAAGQLHARNVAKIVAEAIRKGVQPITDNGEELIMLDPQGLASWVEAHLGPVW